MHFYWVTLYVFAAMIFFIRKPVSSALSKLAIANGLLVFQESCAPPHRGIKNCYNFFLEFQKLLGNKAQRNHISREK